MDFSYEQVAVFAQQRGLLYFFLIFTAICVYALWPKNKTKFDHAAQIPLPMKLSTISTIITPARWPQNGLMAHLRRWRVPRWSVRS